MKLYRNAIILVIIVALLVGAYFLISRNKADEETEDTGTENLLKLTDYTSDEVESVKLQNPDGTFIIVKKDTEWKLSSPTDFTADSSVLSSIVINAASLTADKLVEENAGNMATYGLDKPIIITLKLKDGTEKVLEIGNQTPTESGYYGRLSGENKVYVLGSYSGEKLVIGKNGLRSKAIYSIASDTINQLSMDRDGQNVFVSEMDANKNWSMVQPIKGSMNSSALTPMLEAVASLTVTDFVEDKPADLSKYGLDKPSYSLGFKTADGKAYKLIMGAEKTKGSDIYVKLDGKDEVYLMDISAFTFLDKPLKEIVDVFAYIVNIDQVKKIDLTMDGKTTTMTLDVYTDAEGKTDVDKDKFTVNGKDASGKDDKDKQPFRTFYQSLIGISLDEVDVNGTPAGAPEISINYTLKNGTMKVDYISKDANYYYVVRNGEYAGILVKKNKGDLGVIGMRESYKTMMDFLAAQK